MVGTTPLLERKEKRRGMQPLLCLFWTLWKERNRRIFEDTELADQAILQSFLYTFSDWVRVHVDCTSWSIFDFIDWLGCK